MRISPLGRNDKLQLPNFMPVKEALHFSTHSVLEITKNNKLNEQAYLHLPEKNQHRICNYCHSFF